MGAGPGRSGPGPFRAGAAAMSSLFCSCGRSFFPVGVAPGGLAQCPSCGAWRRVPARAPDPRDVAERPIPDHPRQRARLFARRRRLGEAATLGEALSYPVRDGPGIALLVVMPPLVWFLSVPVLDLIRFTWSGPRGNFNPFALVLLPFFVPLGLCFALILGYVLLVLGAVLVSSAMGEYDHPRWPVWDRFVIIEGLGRWFWALAIGLGIGGAPVAFYFDRFGADSPADRVILAFLIVLAAGYAQMALAAALLHDSLLAANPWTVLVSIARIGTGYVLPSLTAGVAALGTIAAFYFALFHAPSLEIAAVGLWAAWLVAVYLAMVAVRMLGLTYDRYAARLAWFGARPKWEITGRMGRIYVNS